MKCPNCNTILEADYKFCPKCRFRLNRMPEADNEQSASAQSGESGNFASANHLNVVKNKATWEIATGEIARHVSESDFANLEFLSGILVQDGTTAVIHIDGKEVAQLSGGTYNFVSDAEATRILEQRVVDNHSLRGLVVGSWRSLVKAVCGQKVGDSDEETDEKKRTLDEVIRLLNRDSRIAIYLKIDNLFPSVYGYDPKKEGAASFVPWVIKTKFVDTEVAVTMFMKITDFKAFIREYMCGKSSVTTADIQQTLAIHVKNVLQEELRNEEIDEFGIRTATRERIAARFKELEKYLHGIRIVHIADITTNSKDFERFRLLSKELYCSEKELDFLRRSNEFRNRLAVAENAQSVQEKKTALETAVALDEINKDGLLHADEIEQFKEMLEQQKRIRRAGNEMEEEKSLSAIDKIRLQNIADFAKNKLNIEAGLAQHRIETESDIEDANFAAYKRQRVRDSEAVDIEQVIYGKKYLARKQSLLDEFETESMKRRYGHAAALEDAGVRNELTGKELEGRKMVDSYEEEVARKAHELEQIQENARLENLRKKQDMSLSALERMAMMKESSADKEHARKMEEELLAHKERMAAIAAEENMSSEKLFVKNLPNIGGEAAATYAASFSSKQEAEAAKREAGLTKEQAAREAQLYEKMLAMQQQATDKMMGFAERSMQTNASLVSGEASKRDEREQQQFDRIERVASQRIADVKEQKDEYREQMKHEQQRVDQNQEKALNYTTRTTEAELRAPKETPAKSYQLEPFGPVPFTFEQVAAFVANGMINKQTVISANGVKQPAHVYPELKPVFDKYAFVVCPSCGQKVKGDKFCTNCGADL